MAATDNTQLIPPKPIEPVLNLSGLTEVLIKHYGLHEGKYDLLMEFQIGTGMFGPTEETKCPSAFIGVSNIGLIPSLMDSPTTVDAAKVNPQKKKIKKV